MDFSKAFDKVSHIRLMYKLKGFGIDGQTHDWIGRFLMDRTQRVVVDGSHSEESKVESGVPQGTVLGPILFLLYINDLPEYPVDCLFADDCVIYRNIKSANDSHLLQQDLRRLEEWEKTWKMEFNPLKCCTLNITRKRNRQRNQYCLKGVTLQNEESVDYLGVTIRDDLKWTSHINKIVGKANKSLGFIRRNVKTTNRDTKVSAFNTLVRPHVEYACAAWDPYNKCDIDLVQSIQRRGARYTCNRYHNMSSPTQMLKSLEWETLASRRIKLKLCLFFKIHHGITDVTFPPHVHLAAERTRRSHPSVYFELPSSTEYYKYSYFPSTIRVWNILPPGVVKAESLDQFKSGLSKLSF